MAPTKPSASLGHSVHFRMLFQELSSVGELPIMSVVVKIIRLYDTLLIPEGPARVPTWK